MTTRDSLHRLLDRLTDTEIEALARIAKKVVLAKLAPAFGKRSRSLKNVVVEGEGGQEAWNVLKRRVQLVKNLK